MRWLPLAEAWIIAPALVIAVAYTIAVCAGLAFTVFVAIGIVLLIIYLHVCIVRRIGCARNPIHRTNRKYLKDRLRHIPY